MEVSGQGWEIFGTHLSGTRGTGYRQGSSFCSLHEGCVPQNLKQNQKILTVQRFLCNIPKFLEICGTFCVYKVVKNIIDAVHKGDSTQHCRLLCSGSLSLPRGQRQDTSAWNKKDLGMEVLNSFVWGPHLHKELLFPQLSKEKNPSALSFVRDLQEMKCYLDVLSPCLLLAEKQSAKI